MKNIDEILAVNLKSLRKARGWTQSKLAEKSRVSLQSIANYEIQNRWPEKPYIEALAKAFKVPESELFRDRSVEKSEGTLSISDASEILSKIASTIPERRALVLAILFGDTSYLDGVDLSKISEISQHLLKSK